MLLLLPKKKRSAVIATDRAEKVQYILSGRGSRARYGTITAEIADTIEEIILTK
jgi:hypothetical protein